MPYTSGTTGQPKGCMHTHRGVMYSVVSGMQWFGTYQNAVMLAALPWFHVTGMISSMHGRCMPAPPSSFCRAGIATWRRN
jgi:fatty-acyl-CoA synthase